MVYSPARICMPPMETDLSYKVFVSSEVMDAVNDTQVNVYRDVFEHLVKPVIEQEQPDVVGISIVLQQQMFSSMTFCALIKQHFPHIHVTIGGNTVTRLRDVLPESPLFQYFDSAVVYEGETAFVQLVSAVGAKRSLADVPNTIYKDETGRACVADRALRRTWPRCRRRTSMDCRWISISCRRRSCPIWRRAAVTGAAASSATMAKAIRRATGRRRFRTFSPTSSICATSTAPSIFTLPMSPIRRRSFESSSRGLIESKMDIVWTTHMRFEKSLLEDRVWQDAKDSGCRYLHFGYESGNERVLKLMDKATTTEIMTKHLQATRPRSGIWNHCMGFFGFPGETREEAWSSVEFLEQNKELCPFAGVRHVRSRQA